jgi:hypothetical protein
LHISVRPDRICLQYVESYVQGIVGKNQEGWRVGGEIGRDRGIEGGREGGRQGGRARGRDGGREGKREGRSEKAGGWRETFSGLCPKGVGFLLVKDVGVLFCHF